MTIGKAIAFVLLVAATASINATTATGQVAKNEPQMGKLKLGQKVLVDDGSCPAGQIKEVTGGDHRNVGGKQRIERTRRCIPRR